MGHKPDVDETEEVSEKEGGNKSEAEDWQPPQGIASTIKPPDSSIQELAKSARESSLSLGLDERLGLQLEAIVVNLDHNWPSRRTSALKALTEIVTRAEPSQLEGIKLFVEIGQKSQDSAVSQKCKKLAAQLGSDNGSGLAEDQAFSQAQQAADLRGHELHHFDSELDSLPQREQYLRANGPERLQILLDLAEHAEQAQNQREAAIYRKLLEFEVLKAAKVWAAAPDNEKENARQELQLLLQTVAQRIDYGTAGACLSPQLTYNQSKASITGENDVFNRLLTLAKKEHLNPAALKELENVPDQVRHQLVIEIEQAKIFAIHRQSEEGKQSIAHVEKFLKPDVDPAARKSVLTTLEKLNSEGLPKGRYSAILSELRPLSLLLDLENSHDPRLFANALRGLRGMAKEGNAFAQEALAKIDRRIALDFCLRRLSAEGEAEEKFAKETAEDLRSILFGHAQQHRLIEQKKQELGLVLKVSSLPEYPAKEDLRELETRFQSLDRFPKLPVENAQSNNHTERLLEWRQWSRTNVLRAQLEEADQNVRHNSIKLLNKEAIEGNRFAGAMLRDLLHPDKQCFDQINVRSCRHGELTEAQGETIRLFIIQEFGERAKHGSLSSDDYKSLALVLAAPHRSPTFDEQSGRYRPPVTESAKEIFIDNFNNVLDQNSPGKDWSEKITIRAVQTAESLKGLFMAIQDLGTDNPLAEQLVPLYVETARSRYNLKRGAGPSTEDRRLGLGKHDFDDQLAAWQSQAKAGDKLSLSLLAQLSAGALRAPIHSGKGAYIPEPHEFRLSKERAEQLSSLVFEITKSDFDKAKVVLDAIDENKVHSTKFVTGRRLEYYGHDFVDGAAKLELVGRLLGEHHNSLDSNTEDVLKKQLLSGCWRSGSEEQRASAVKGLLSCSELLSEGDWTTICQWAPKELRQQVCSGRFGLSSESKTRLCNAMVSTFILPRDSDNVPKQTFANKEQLLVAIKYLGPDSLSPCALEKLARLGSRSGLERLAEMKLDDTDASTLQWQLTDGLLHIIEKSKSAEMKSAVIMAMSKHDWPNLDPHYLDKLLRANPDNVALQYALPRMSYELDEMIKNRPHHLTPAGLAAAFFERGLSMQDQAAYKLCQDAIKNYGAANAFTILRNASIYNALSRVRLSEEDRAAMPKQLQKAWPEYGNVLAPERLLVLMAAGELADLPPPARLIVEAKAWKPGEQQTKLEVEDYGRLLRDARLGAFKSIDEAKEALKSCEKGLKEKLEQLTSSQQSFADKFGSSELAQRFKALGNIENPFADISAKKSDHELSQEVQIDSLVSAELFLERTRKGLAEAQSRVSHLDGLIESAVLDGEFMSLLDQGRVKAAHCHAIESLGKQPLHALGPELQNALLVQKGGNGINRPVMQQLHGAGLTKFSKIFANSDLEKPLSPIELLGCLNDTRTHWDLESIALEAGNQILADKKVQRIHQLSQKIFQESNTLNTMMNHLISGGDKHNAFINEVQQRSKEIRELIECAQTGQAPKNLKDKELMKLLEQISPDDLNHVRKLRDDLKKLEESGISDYKKQVVSKLREQLDGTILLFDEPAGISKKRLELTGKWHQLREEQQDVLKDIAKMGFLWRNVDDLLQRIDNNTNYHEKLSRLVHDLSNTEGEIWKLNKFTNSNDKIVTNHRNKIEFMLLLTEKHELFHPSNFATWWKEEGSALAQAAAEWALCATALGAITKGSRLLSGINRAVQSQPFQIVGSTFYMQWATDRITDERFKSAEAATGGRWGSYFRGDDVFELTQDGEIRYRPRELFQDLVEPTVKDFTIGCITASLATKFAAPIGRKIQTTIYGRSSQPVGKEIGSLAARPTTQHRAAHLTPGQAVGWITFPVEAALLEDQLAKGADLIPFLADQHCRSVIALSLIMGVKHGLRPVKLRTASSETNPDQSFAAAARSHAEFIVEHQANSKQFAEFRAEREKSGSSFSKTKSGYLELTREGLGIEHQFSTPEVASQQHKGQIFKEVDGRAADFSIRPSDQPAIKPASLNLQRHVDLTNSARVPREMEVLRNERQQLRKEIAELEAQKAALAKTDPQAGVLRLEVFSKAVKQEANHFEMIHSLNNTLKPLRAEILSELGGLEKEISRKSKEFQKTYSEYSNKEHELQEKHFKMRGQKGSEENLRKTEKELQELRDERRRLGEQHRRELVDLKDLKEAATRLLKNNPLPEFRTESQEKPFDRRRLENAINKARPSEIALQDLMGLMPESLDANTSYRMTNAKNVEITVSGAIPRELALEVLLKLGDSITKPCQLELMNDAGRKINGIAHEDRFRSVKLNFADGESRLAVFDHEVGHVFHFDLARSAPELHKQVSSMYRQALEIAAGGQFNNLQLSELRKRDNINPESPPKGLSESEALTVYYHCTNEVFAESFKLFLREQQLVEQGHKLNYKDLVDRFVTDPERRQAMHEFGDFYKFVKSNVFEPAYNEHKSPTGKPAPGSQAKTTSNASSSEGFRTPDASVAPKTAATESAPFKKLQELPPEDREVVNSLREKGSLSNNAFTNLMKLDGKSISELLNSTPKEFKGVFVPALERSLIDPSKFNDLLSMSKQNRDIALDFLGKVANDSTKSISSASVSRFLELDQAARSEIAKALGPDGQSTKAGHLSAAAVELALKCPIRQSVSGNQGLSDATALVRAMQRNVLTAEQVRQFGGLEESVRSEISCLLKNDALTSVSASKLIEMVKTGEITGATLAELNAAQLRKWLSGQTLENLLQQEDGVRRAVIRAMSSELAKGKDGNFSMSETLGSVAKLSDLHKLGVINEATMQHLSQPHPHDTVFGELFRGQAQKEAPERVSQECILKLVELSQKGELSIDTLEAYRFALAKGVLEPVSLKAMLELRPEVRKAAETLMMSSSEKFADLVKSGRFPEMLTGFAGSKPAAQAEFPDMFPEGGKFEFEANRTQLSSPQVKDLAEFMSRMSNGDYKGALAFVEGKTVTPEQKTPTSTDPEIRWVEKTIRLAELNNPEKLAELHAFMKSQGTAKGTMTEANNPNAVEKRIRVADPVIEMPDGKQFRLRDSSRIMDKNCWRQTTATEKAMIERIQASQAGKAILGKTAMIVMEEWSHTTQQGSGGISKLTDEFTKSPHYQAMRTALAERGLKGEALEAGINEALREIDIAAAIKESGLSSKGVQKLFGDQHLKGEREYFYRFLEMEPYSAQPAGKKAGLEMSPTTADGLNAKPETRTTTEVTTSDKHASADGRKSSASDVRRLAQLDKMINDPKTSEESAATLLAEARALRTKLCGPTGELTKIIKDLEESQPSLESTGKMIVPSHGPSGNRTEAIGFNEMVDVLREPQNRQFKLIKVKAGTTLDGIGWDYLLIDTRNGNFRFVDIKEAFRKDKYTDFHYKNWILAGPPHLGQETQRATVRQKFGEIITDLKKNGSPFNVFEFSLPLDRCSTKPVEDLVSDLNSFPKQTDAVLKKWEAIIEVRLKALEAFEKQFAPAAENREALGDRDSARHIRDMARHLAGQRNFLESVNTMIKKKQVTEIKAWLDKTGGGY